MKFEILKRKYAYEISRMINNDNKRFSIFIPAGGGMISILTEIILQQLACGKKLAILSSQKVSLEYLKEVLSRQSIIYNDIFMKLILFKEFHYYLIVVILRIQTVVL